MQEQYSVGIYARLSRDDERAGESVSIENQKEMLARYVREQGWTLYDYYCDDGVSGTTFMYPGKPNRRCTRRCTIGIRNVQWKSL